MRHLKSRFPKPPTPPRVDSEIQLGALPQRMQKTMDVNSSTPDVSEDSLMLNNAVLLKEWLDWCRSTGREAHAAELIEKTRAHLRNQ